MEYIYGYVYWRNRIISELDDLQTIVFTILPQHSEDLVVVVDPPSVVTSPDQNYGVSVCAYSDPTLQL